MKRMFNYTKSANETQNALVEAFMALSNAYAEGKQNTPEYKDANRQFNEDFMKECVAAIPGMEFSELESTIKNPAVHNDLFFLHRFDMILAQMINPIVPTVLANGYDEFYDVVQLGYGDAAKYTVESNELFILNDQAQGIARGAVQTDFRTEYSIQAYKKEIGAFVDWYHIACNKQDWGK